MALTLLPDARCYRDYDYFLEHCACHPPADPPSAERLIYHCFWCGSPLGPHHELSLKSLLITQSQPYEVWFWMPPADLDSNRDFRSRFEEFPWVRFKPYIHDREALGTPFCTHMDVLLGGSICISDGFRLLVLRQYGGIYFDLDVLFLRDLRDLSCSEFCYQWSNRSYGNTAVLRLLKTSDNCEALIRRAIDIRCTHPSKLFTFRELNRLTAGLVVFPSFLFDPVWIANDTGQVITAYCNRVDDFFESERSVRLDAFFKGSYAYHWHNRWNTVIREGTIVANLYKEIDHVLTARRASGIR